MANFRPVSLCRVIYKMVTKTLANRLKEVIPMCISQNQSAFVPNRMIHDNVLVTHELMHYLRSSKNGPNKGCVVKLDMSKAYDRVEWSFLEKVMLKMGFYNDWVIRIMDRVKCNTTLSDVITPERGLRQGDPNNQNEVEAFTEILESFEKMSGQSINLDKNMVYFSPNTPTSQRATLSGLLKMKVVSNLDGYLGLPIPIGKKKSAAFHGILDRVAKRIDSWSKRLLSNGGKKIFIKSILQSIPTYAFLVFYAPNSVLEEFQTLIKRVWWGGKENNRGSNMVAWDCLCYLKGMGGLGFRDLRRFNVALLGRLVWRLINCKETLCYKVLSAKYFPDGNVLNPKSMDKLSYTWQSITKAASILHAGFGWNVQENRVSELLNDSKDGWHEERVKELYGDYLRDQICKIPSAYSWLTLKHVGYGPHWALWRLMWKLQTLPKIRIFCWCLDHEILPMNEKIASIRSGFDSTCLRCGLEKETLIHALKNCPIARAVLEHGGLNNNLLEGDFNWCCDWIEGATNNRIFHGVEKEARMTWERAASLSHDFRIFNLLDEPLLPRKPEDKAWSKPAEGRVKINFDASVSGKRMYFGLVAKDSNGFVLGGRMGVLDKEVQIEWAEMLALEESIYLARLKRWNKVEMETNCVSLVNRYNNKNTDLTMFGHRMREIHMLLDSFNCFNFKWAPSCCNKIADKLCTLALANICTVNFNMDYPADIHDLVLNDAIK
ncbi:hypothetical protein CXB51_010592 [Gossypium anomalum]|uniref:Reverse transcriptase n=1 Tax=Gossypium anomalum TaxID=47600 RepID=A0A8J5Z903_9ROSI|nr:hypothetical protein CXB51_010592 [Gossypium anomalum]